MAFRLFVTCWLVYSLHFATNIVREHYLALAIGDHFSFRVDEYAGLHDDIFETKGHGWHINSNPGVSMLAAIPYAMFQPIIDHIVDRVQHRRKVNGEIEAPRYDTPVSKDEAFYREAWRRGFDIKFALAAFVIQSMCMAPSSALGVVVMFSVLLQIFKCKTTALWLALLYGFGTPVFFRTGFLNHNLMLGHIAFGGFLLMWNPSGSQRWSTSARSFLGGVAGGTALLFDYSGAVLLVALGCYGMVKRWPKGKMCSVIRQGCWYTLGTLGPIGILWLYQWQSFGHPLYPPQHWMPPVEWSNMGYQGLTWPQLELLISLAFDYRYGLFLSSPLLLLAVPAPLLNRITGAKVSRLELIWMVGIFVALWLFFGGVNYTRWQFNTGVRYMAPIFPFLFVPAAVVLMCLPRKVIFLTAMLSFAQSWSLAMCRDVAAGQIGLNEGERGLGVLDPILHVFWGGFQLPALTTLSRMKGLFGEYFAHGVSPLPLFFLTVAVLWLVWRCPRIANDLSKRQARKVGHGGDNL